MYPREEKEFQETVVQINRVSKKTKGGNQIRFSALVVVGDKKGKVGAGLNRAPDVVSGIKKSIDYARRHLINVPLKGTTIPYEMTIKNGAAKILLKPAKPGSGIVAGGPVRVVFEAAGVRDVVAKMLGSRNKTANVYTVLKALKQMDDLYKKKKQASRKESKKDKS